MALNDVQKTNGESNRWRYFGGKKERNGKGTFLKNVIEFLRKLLHNLIEIAEGL